MYSSNSAAAAGGRGGLREAELAVGSEVERGGLGLPGRPGIVGLPLVAAGFKDIGRGELRIGRAFEVMLEEWELDLLAIEDALLAVEPDVAEMVAIGTRPATVEPWAHDELYIAVRAFGVGRLVGVQRSPEIFGIKPASDGEHGGTDVLEVLGSGAGLPERVVVGMLNDILPPGDFVVIVAGIDVRERLDVAEEEIVAVGRRRTFEGVWPLGGELRTRLAEGEHEAEHLRQVEGAVVMEVVAEEPVGDGCLRRDSLERGMGVDGRHDGVEAGIGDAPGADASVVVGDVLDQPRDAVIGIAGLIDILGTFFGGDVGAHILEGAFAEELSAHILVDKDVLGTGEEFGGSEHGLVLILTVGCDRVRRAIEENRIGVVLAGILGDIDAGEEFDAIAHGNAVLKLGVVRLDPRGEFILRRLFVGGLGHGEHDIGADKEHGRQVRPPGAKPMSIQFVLRKCEYTDE